MRLGKLVLGIASLLVLASFSYAQPSTTLSIHLQKIGSSYNATDVSTLTALPASAPQSVSIDPSEFGGSNFYFVQVTVRGQLTQHDPNAWRGISIINTYINLAGTGLTIYDGFTTDEAGYDNDARKNVNSHILGGPISDCAANSGLINNSGQAWNSSAQGGPLPQPAAVGKSIYTSPRTSTSPFAMYSFVVVVPRQLNTTFNVAFDRVLSGGTANTDPTVKTNVLGLAPSGSSSVQSQLTVLNGQIEVIPEPASMIALGSGLVGLLALRRRRSN
jgi:hypothetical protein